MTARAATLRQSEVLRFIKAADSAGKELRIEIDHVNKRTRVEFIDKDKRESGNSWDDTLS